MDQRAEPSSWRPDRAAPAADSPPAGRVWEAPAAEDGLASGDAASSPSTADVYGAETASARGDVPPGDAPGPARVGPLPRQRTSPFGRGTGVGPGAAAQSGGRPRAVASAPSGRRADLVVSRVDPWSVMKFSFLVSLVAWVVLFVAVSLLYFALSQLGVFHSIQTTLHGITSSQSSAGLKLSQWLSASKVLGYTMLAGAVNVVLFTALSTIGAVIYNLITHLGGGIEITLKETD